MGWHCYLRAGCPLETAHAAAHLQRVSRVSIAPSRRAPLVHNRNVPLAVTPHHPPCPQLLAPESRLEGTLGAVKVPQRVLGRASEFEGPEVVGVQCCGLPDSGGGGGLCVVICNRREVSCCRRSSAKGVGIELGSSHSGSCRPPHGIPAPLLGGPKSTSTLTRTPRRQP